MNKMNPTKKDLTVFAAVLIFAVAGSFAKETPENAKILKMTDPYEVLAENIPSGDIKDVLAVEKAFEKAESLKAGTKAILSGGAGAEFDIAYTAMQDARAKKDAVGIAIAAAEIYKLIIESLNAATLVIPKDVDLLDYIGFRGVALLKASPQNWEAIVKNATVANVYWKRIHAKVTHEKLAAAVDKSLKDMAASAASHDSAANMTAAKELLDLVDELENYYTGKPVSVS